MTTFSATIDKPWLDVVPIRVGHMRAGLATPDRYLTATVGGQRVRLDLYGGNDPCPFEEASEWRGWLVVGWRGHVHWVDLAGRAVKSFALGSSFGRLYPAPDALFATSAERLFRFGTTGELVWSSGVLGIDGVVLESWSGDVLAGLGEWDPPDGWRPFRVDRGTGASAGTEPDDP